MLPSLEDKDAWKIRPVRIAALVSGSAGLATSGCLDQTRKTSSLTIGKVNDMNSCHVSLETQVVSLG